MLNPEQQAAVTAIEGPVMVLAGPGTGKTQILASRIEEILKRTQLDPHNILCLTFTDSGVVAMRERLKSKIGSAAYFVQIHTFHSFCNMVIQENAEAFSETRELESLSELERVQILREILAARPARSPWVPFENPYQNTKTLSGAISTLKREDIQPLKLKQILDELGLFLKSESAQMLEELVQINGHHFTEDQLQQLLEIVRNSPLKECAEQAFDWSEKKERTAFKKLIKETYASMREAFPKQQALQEIFVAFEHALETRGRYDFEDMILFVVRKFKSDPWILSRYQERFQYILVDEYQDSNGSQNELLNLLTTHHETPNLFVVGDDKQSIYRFQGASLENILYFFKRFSSDLTLISLKENYRSGQAILDAAHALISSQAESAPAAMGIAPVELNAAAEPTQEKPEWREFETEEDERGGLAILIQNAIEEGTPANEIAILVHENAEMDAIAESLAKLNIPVHLYAGKNLLKDPFILNLINFLHAIEEPWNDARLYRALNWSIWGFEPEVLLRFLIEHRSRRRPLMSVLMEDPKFKPWTDMLARVLKLSHEETLTDWFPIMIRESGIHAHVMQSENALEILNRLQSFHTHICSWNKQKHDLRIKNVLENIDLYIEHDIGLQESEFQSAASAVHVLTAHKSKGLEFEMVFIPHLEDGRWGNRKKRDSVVYPAGLLTEQHRNALDEQNADETRLLYVAMTRAKKKLRLSYAKKNGQGRLKSPSIFLAEINENLLNHVDTQALAQQVEKHRPEWLFADSSSPLHSVRDLIAPLVEDFVLSASTLNSYLRCPRRFLYETIIKMPTEDSRSLAFGRAIHKALEELHQQHRKEEFPGVSFLLEQFDSALEHEVLTPSAAEQSRAYGHSVLQAFHEAFSPQFHPMVHPEYGFMTQKVRIEGIPVNGKLDLIELLEDSSGEVRVIDYKTGKPDTKRDELLPGGDYHRQIVFYQLLCDHARYFQYHMKQGEIRFVEPMEDGSFRREFFTVTAEDKARVIAEMKAVYDDIVNMRFLELTPEEGCGLCEYCLAAQGAI